MCQPPPRPLADVDYGSIGLDPVLNQHVPVGIAALAQKHQEAGAQGGTLSGTVRQKKFEWSCTGKTDLSRVSSGTPPRSLVRREELTPPDSGATHRIPAALLH